MIRNDPTALNRRIYVPFFDGNGRFLAGQTFATASAEVLVSLDGATEVAAAADAVAIGGGGYYYPASQAETNCGSFLAVRFRKQATLALTGLTTHLNCTITAKNAVDGGNSFTLTSVQSSGVSPTTGTLVKVGNAYVFTWKDSVTTEANFESLIAASADLAIKTTGTGANVLVTPGDLFSSASLTGGFSDSVVVQHIDQGPWAVLGEGSHTYGDLMRLYASILAAKVSGFATGTLVFRDLADTKNRLTETDDSTGRIASTIGDLT